MTKDKEFIVVKTTYPNINQARELSQILLEKKLATCVQLVPIESYYLWNNTIENSREILLLIKTKSSYYVQVEMIIKQHCQYETPQIIANKIDFIASDYANWFDDVI